MALKSSVDAWPIILDSSGLPLSYGILYYTKVGTTTVPKSVYRDIARTDEFPNAVVECDANGRTVAQVFLGYGEYTVIAHRFAGADPLNTEPSDWCPDNQWTEYGLPIPEIAIESYYTEVDTIADLRAVDTDLYTDCLVLGYYEAGDMAPRTYHWIGASGTLSENGGTTIESTHSTGFWTLAIGNTDVVDARIFGMFPAVADCLPIMQAISQTIVSYGPISRCYVPAGVYSLGLTVDALFHSPFIFDDGCQFTTTSATSYVLAFPRGTEIRGNHCFTDISSATSIFPQFRWGAVVNPKWWYNCYSDGMEWNNALKRMVDNISSIDTVLISDSIFLSTIDNVKITSNVHFTESGSITLNDPVGTLSFCGPCRITVDAGCLSPLRGSALYSYRFLRIPYIRSSWFTSAGSSLLSPYTEDLSLVVSANNATVANGCKLICDTAQSKFNTSLSNANASRITVLWESGTLVASSTITGHTVYLPQAELGAYNCIQGHGFILGCTTHLRNFVPAYTGSALVTSMLTAAMRSAVQGSGTLDLDSYDVTTQTPELPNTLSVSSKSLYICNGTIRTPDTNSMLSVACSPESIILEGVEWVVTTSALYSIMLNSYGVSNNINRVLFDNVTCDGNTHENRSSVLYFPTTIVSYVNIMGSNLDAFLFGDGRISNLHLGASTLPSGYSGNTWTTTTQINGCRILGRGDKEWKEGGGKPIITGNYFLSAELTLKSYNQKLQPVIYGNQFESTDADRSYVTLIAMDENAVISGANILGNSFIGATTTEHIAIRLTTYWPGFFATDDRHRMCVTANTSGSLNTLVPLTRGTPTLGNVDVNTIYDIGYARALDNVELTHNKGLLVVPVANGSRCVKYLNASRNRITTSTALQSSIAWSGRMVYEPLDGTISVFVRYQNNANVRIEYGYRGASIVIEIY